METLQAIDWTVRVGGQVIPWPVVGFFAVGYAVVLANALLAFSAFLNWATDR